MPNCIANYILAASFGRWLQVPSGDLQKQDIGRGEVCLHDRIGWWGATKPKPTIERPSQAPEALPDAEHSRLVGLAMGTYDLHAGQTLFYNSGCRKAALISMSQ